MIPAAGGGDAELSGVAPGTYTVSSVLFDHNQVAPLGSHTANLISDATIHFSETIQTSVKGKVILDGDVPPSMSATLGNVANGNPEYAPVKPDGTFEFANVLPGRYTLLLASAGDLYMQAVKVKGGVYKEGELPVARGAAIELTITAAKGVTKVNGKAIHESTAIAGAMVLLVPQDPSHGNFIPRDQSDSDGTFTLNWALPGRYTLVAIDNGRDLPYADPAVIARYLPGGKVLNLPLGKDEKVEVEVQSRK